MRPSRLLIDALRQTADDIANQGKRYAWHERESCNCGILAQNLLGLKPHELKVEIACSLMRGEGFGATPCDTWSEMSRICPETGLPVADIISTLMTYGLDQGDFNRIEYLGGDVTKPFSHAPSVVDWLRLQATQLESQLPPISQTEKEYAKVGVTI